jgi:hypothetical protein
MELKVKKDLKPCPVCGSHDIIWGGYYYISLICKKCYFEMWPFDDFASEESYYEEWDSLDNLETAMEQCAKKLQIAKSNNDEKQVHILSDLLLHYESLQENMNKARKNVS